MKPQRPAVLSCGLTRSGQIELFAPEHSTETDARIIAAFANGRGPGVLHLGAGEREANLDPSLAFWRDLGQIFIARVCASDLDATPDAQQLGALRVATPPMRGAELISLELLAEIWAELRVALGRAAGRRKDGVQRYLETESSLWNVVGRVCFHLAENKSDPDYPFAFIATYARDLSKPRKLRHVPLGRALQEYAGAKNRNKLVALLEPLQRAAQRSELMRALVDAGDVYHPLAWSPADAHQFLREIPLYEQSGVVVRVPDWWSSKHRRRPQVTVSIGKKAPSNLGADALLDFDVALTLGGAALSKTEASALLAATDGLVLIKGKWIELDRDKLEQVLTHWRDVEERAQIGGISFAEAMRMLAGADVRAAQGADVDSRPEWTEVVAGKWLSASLESLRSPTIRSEIERGAGLKAQLRPYQKLGIQWLWTLRGLELGGCLADDMGLGKTIQVLAVLEMLRRKKVAGTDLLVVPASLLDNWRAEAERFAPRLDLLIAHPSHMRSAELKALDADAVDEHDAVITTYGTVMRSTWMQSFGWRGVILDEAQAIKNAGSKQTRAVKALPARWRVALTGTPVENRLGDLWSIFDFLNPGLLGSAKEFGRFTKALSARQHNAYAPLRNLVQPYVLRRLKTDRSVISDLPDKTEVSAHCLLSKKQAALYQRSVEEMENALATRKGIARRGVVLAFLTRFKQICNHPSHWLGDDGWTPRDSGKFSRLEQLCESIAARQDKALVFTQFREMTRPLAKFLEQVFGRPGLVLHGGTPVKKRRDLVRSFQEDDDVGFMVLSLKAGGTGLNLTAASHVIHFDRWWNPAVENQATDRAFRIGQKKNVLVHKFVCRGTVEERIDELIESKQKLSDEILSGGADKALTEMSNDELLALVTLDVNSALETA